MEQVPFLTAAIAVASVAVYTDTRRTRIPNWLTFPALGVGLAMHAILGGTEALMPSLQGAGLGLLLFLVPFLIGGMGAGDVKLLAALGAFVGPEHVFIVFFVSALVGGVTGLLVLARRFGWQTAGL